MYVGGVGWDGGFFVSDAARRKAVRTCYMYKVKKKTITKKKIKNSSIGDSVDEITTHSNYHKNLLTAF